jgi:hypothetical protein
MEVRIHASIESNTLNTFRNFSDSLAQVGGELPHRRTTLPLALPGNAHQQDILEAIQHCHA